MQDEDAARRKVGCHGQGTRKTLRKVIIDNFPQWVFFGAKVAERTRVMPGSVIAMGGCRAEPGWPSVTDPARHPPRQATNRSGVPGRARSVRTRVTPGSVTAVGVAGSGSIGLLWRTRPGTPHGRQLTGRECRARPRQGKVKGKRVIQLNLLLPYSLPYPIATC